MWKLFGAECKKMRRLNIIWIAMLAAIMIAVIIFIDGFSMYNGRRNIYIAGWYMEKTQPMATVLVLPALVALIGSYMICREDEEDTMKSLRIIPINEAKLTAVKMLITFIFSVLIYLFLFMLTVLVEAVLHFSDLTAELIFMNFRIYALQGIGVFLAVSPIIALISYMKKNYWIAFILTEMYSVAGMFMSMSNTLRTFYPITASFGMAGYYETALKNRIESILVLVLCGCLSIFLLKGKSRKAL